MSKHINRKYRVRGDRRTFERLNDARNVAEELMSSLPDDDSVMILAQDEDEDFYEPYASIMRKQGRFILRNILRN